ncbi:MAG TPA: laccase domain-containing protein [Candidatus Eisenbacteria bacterium]|nr:laccase domain-containing protein [Candidatus Eisenbacteria bacterium]
MKKILLYPVGVVCIVVGTALLVLPGPGIPIIFIGLTIVAPRHAVRLRRWAGRTFLRDETFHWTEWQPFSAHAGFTTKRFPLLLKKTDDLLDLSNQEAFKRFLWKSQVVLGREKASAGRFVFLNQVHGSNVAVLEDPKLYDRAGFYHQLKSDGVITNIRRLTLLVLSADCLPVFLCAVQKDVKRSTAQWVGLLHAGWRGTREGIAGKGARLLAERSGLPPGSIHAAFGPCIGPQAYEVGEEFAGYFPASALVRSEGKLYFDLAGENRRQLIEAGVPAAQILESKICTLAQNRHYHSYRGEKDDAGRIISFLTAL